MKSKDIIKLARNLKKELGTNDPFYIARYFGIEVLFRDSRLAGFTAQTIKITDCPTIISINNAFTDFSKKVLCAHELGHAILHENCVNYFATTSANVKNEQELEANLFAVALLTADNIDSQLNVPLEKMNNYLLKSILDYNIRLTD